MILRTIDIHKRFGGINALRGVSLDVNEGEILGIIGPNGSGKTTLINAISGFIKLDKGKVIYRGRDITNSPPYLRAKLGIVRTFQIPRPLAELTVMENTAVAAMISGRDKEEMYRYSETILEQVGLASSAHKKAGMLSVIEKKRLELARALALNPKLVMLDETLAGARGNELTSLLEIIKNLKDKGITVIMVEHIIGAVSSVSDRIVVLNEGVKIADGHPKEVLEDYEVIKAYIGETA